MQKLTRGLQLQISSFASARLVNGLDDLRVPGAATEITREPFADFLSCGMWVLVQKIRGGCEHTGSTDSALCAAGLGEGLLQRVKIASFCKFLNRADVGA